MESKLISTGKVTLIEDGIVVFETNDDVIVDVQEFLEAHEAIVDLTKGEKYCVIVKTGEFSSYTKKMIDASAAPEYSKNRIAMAVIVSDLATRMIANFYFSVINKAAPTKLFSSDEKALLWLQKKCNESSVIE